MHAIHSLKYKDFTQIDKLAHNFKSKQSATIGVSKTKLGYTASSSKVEIEGYGLV